MKAMDLLQAFGEVNPKYVKSINTFYRASPTWRVIMKKTTKFALTAAAVVLVAGFIFVAWYLQTYGVAPGSEGEKEPLRILVDLDRSHGYQDHSGEDVIQRFLLEAEDYAKAYGGPDDLADCVVEIIPAFGEEREAALTRAATEIMSGNPPDIFICRAGESVLQFTPLTPPEYVYSPALFPFVERQMEEGLFLPLDAYVDTARFVDWEDLIPTVMAGGRNSAGEQVILPMTFTLPLTYYDKQETPGFSGETTWDQVLQSEDPFLANTASWVTENVWYSGKYYDTHWPEDPYFSRLFPSLADYREGALAVSEEELLQRAREALSVQERLDLRVLPFQAVMEVGYDERVVQGEKLEYQLASLRAREQTMVPLYGTGGGAVADITAYCAISRSCKRPADAFFLCDLLLSQDIQKYSSLYDLLATTSSGSMPTHKSLATQDDPFQWFSFGREENHEEWLRVCQQITVARVPNEVDYLLMEMMADLSAGDAGEQASPDPETVAETVHNTYQKMQRLLDES